jgi:hypothetical protein
LKNNDVKKKSTTYGTEVFRDITKLQSNNAGIGETLNSKYLSTTNIKIKY